MSGRTGRYRSMESFISLAVLSPLSFENEMSACKTTITVVIIIIIIKHHHTIIMVVVIICVNRSCKQVLTSWPPAPTTSTISPSPIVHPPHMTTLPPPLPYLNVAAPELDKWCDCKSEVM
jgi:hypothetical protein